jgi:transposase InsO family protein
MPWIEETKVEQRLKFVTRVREENISVAKACREFGISRPTGYKWLKRYGLEDRSRAPDEIPHKTDKQTEERICALRTCYPSFGPKKLRAWLCREHSDADWPAPSTIGDILKRNGMIEERQTRRKTPPASNPLARADAPNRIWSTDFKDQFELENGQMCYPLTITDNYSRMVLGCYALPSTKGEPVKERFEQAFCRWGVPEAIRSDNGAPFASRAPGGLSWLSAWWLSLGIEHERIEPGKPQQNGRHERMHLTLKQQTARPAEANMDDQQRRFDEFVTFFNELRPHEALEQSVPTKSHEVAQRCYQLSP